MLEWYEIITLSLMVVPSVLGWIKWLQRKSFDSPEDNLTKPNELILNCILMGMGKFYLLDKFPKKEIIYIYIYIDTSINILYNEHN